jgi:hypothetical protein
VGTVHAFDHATRRGAPAFYRAILMTSACGGLFVSPAVAQEAPAVPGEEEAGEQIVVNGSRPIVESEEAALQVQKMSDSLVAVAASDSVGRLPDQNIAQAASRLPGIAVERDQGKRAISAAWRAEELDYAVVRRDQRGQPRRA